MNQNVKKFLSVFLGVIMIFSLFTVTSFAEEQKPAIKLSIDGEIAVGNVVRLLVSLENMPEFTQSDFRISFDSSNLECQGVTKPATCDAELWASGIPEDGLATCSICYFSPVKGQCAVAVVVFKVINTANISVEVSAANVDCSAELENATINIQNADAFDPSQADFDFDFELVNSEIIITDCDMESTGDIIIPETIDGYPVTTIAEHAFTSCYRITSVVIPDSVITIGDYAFSGCDGLKNVTIGSGVKTLGNSVFWACENLETVVIENGVTYISDKMFSNCPKLYSVTLPESIASIGYSAFEFCYLLTEINIPANVKTIGKSAFYNCSSLDNVVIPSGVTEILEYTFYECDNLKKITLSNNLKTIGQSAFSGSGLETVNIPSSVTNIDSGAFAGTNLKKVVIPYGIKAISPDTFNRCENLTDVVIPETVTTIGGYAFYGCSSMTSIKIPSSVTEIGYLSVGYSSEILPMSGFTIYGVKGSKAESYALSKRIGFTEVNETSSLFDVNGDGNINAADARIALRVSAKLEVLEGNRFNAADIDKDGKITAADARRILRKSAKLD